MKTIKKSDASPTLVCIVLCRNDTRERRARSRKETRPQHDNTSHHQNHICIIFEA